VRDPIRHPSPPWLTARAQRDPDALALRHGSHTLTYAALAARVEGLAGRLTSLGVRPGDRFAVFMEGSCRLVELLHAAQRCGAAIVPLNTRLAPSEIVGVIADATPRLLLCDRRRLRTLTDAMPRAGTPRLVEARDELDATPPVAPPPLGVLGPDTVHTVLYTSGTTGRPKGVMLTNGNHAASAAASRANLGVAAGDHWLATLPLYHVGGLSILLRGVLDGIPVVLHERFDPARASAAIRRGGITLVSLVPTMLQRLVDHEGDRPFPESLRCVLVGGGPIPSPLVERALACRVPIVPTYGLTEAASQVATAAPGDAASWPQSAGMPVAGVRVRIADPDPSGCGEILVQGATVMAGYLGQPEATARCLRDGWLHTGDVGRLDRDGRLYVLERRTDLILTGGENVYPAEVEAALLAHPAVADAAVYGRPDPEWGQRVVAAVVRRAGHDADEGALRAWCRTRLAGYKIPHAIALVSELPRTTSGKLRRHLLDPGTRD